MIKQNITYLTKQMSILESIMRVKNNFKKSNCHASQKQQ